MKQDASEGVGLCSATATESGDVGGCGSWDVNAIECLWAHELLRIIDWLFLCPVCPFLPIEIFLRQGHHNTHHGQETAESGPYVSRNSVQVLRRHWAL